MKERDYEYAHRSINLDELKSSPNDLLDKINPADSEVIAVENNNEVAFYVVSADLLEDMADLCEYAQRGTLKMEPEQTQIPGEPLDMQKLSEKIAKTLKNINPKDQDEFEEWP